MTCAEDKVRLLELLRQRWLERPDKSLGEVLVQMAYAGAGHTDLSAVTDAEFLKGLEHGWRPL
jgi:uncharacterized protein YihD (DUF1040 family)